MGTVHKFHPADSVAFIGDADETVKRLNDLLVWASGQLRRFGPELRRETFLRMREDHQQLLQCSIALDNVMNSVETSAEFFIAETPEHVLFEMTGANDNREVEAILTCRRRGAVVYISQIEFNYTYVREMQFHCRVVRI